jgi:hypothetical protein
MAQFYGNKVKGSSLSELQCIMAGQTYISWKENDVAAWQGTVSCTTWLVHFAITGILIQFYFWSKQTIAEAVGDWFFNRREVKEIDCEYPCNPTCYNTVLSRPYKEAWPHFPLYHFGDFQHTLHLVIADFFFPREHSELGIDSHMYLTAVEIYKPQICTRETTDIGIYRLICALQLILVSMSNLTGTQSCPWNRGRGWRGNTCTTPMEVLVDAVQCPPFCSQSLIFLLGTR